MTIGYKHQEYTTASGSRLVVEQYADKPHFVKFWRYSINGILISDQLFSRPNVKRLINLY